jgi:hypothetical protein
VYRLTPAPASSVPPLRLRRAVATERAELAAVRVDELGHFSTSLTGQEVTATRAGS